MKDLKISLKLLLGFGIIALLTLVVGTVGAIQLMGTDSSYSKIIEDNNHAFIAISDLRESYQQERVEIRTVLLAAPLGADTVKSYIAKYEDASKDVSDGFAAYEKTVVDKNAEKAFFDAQAAYKLYEVEADKARDLALAGDTTGALSVLGNAASHMNAVSEGLDGTMAFMESESAKDSTNLTGASTTSTIIQAVLALVSVIVAVILGVYISRLIAVPTRGVCEALSILGTTGSLSLPPELGELAQKTAQRKDELGHSAVVFGQLLGRLTYISQELEAIASGDLSSEISLASDQDVMGLSLKKMSENLNRMFADINNSTSQVNSGANQVAHGAQALAQGSTEQAAAVEELSSSISEIAQKTLENADMAERAAELSSAIRDNAEKGASQMDQMMQAVGEINNASQNIGRVIKVIDDIAFQTNILALNAAVEAARAGQHGKGFAVVAEEVRSLAAKSADAAKDTGSLIENSITKSEFGAKIASETAESLNEIVAGINESTAVVNEIAKASDEQSAAIKQVNIGIDQVAQVVQQNSASAQESAAASEEMSSQSGVLSDLISQFKLKDAAYVSRPQLSSGMAGMPEELDYDDFGKY